MGWYGSGLLVIKSAEELEKERMNHPYSSQIHTQDLQEHLWNIRQVCSSQIFVNSGILLKRKMDFSHAVDPRLSRQH